MLVRQWHASNSNNDNIKMLLIYLVFILKIRVVFFRIFALNCCWCLLAQAFFIFSWKEGSIKPTLTHLRWCCWRATWKTAFTHSTHKYNCFSNIHFNTEKGTVLCFEDKLFKGSYFNSNWIFFYVSAIILELCFAIISSIFAFNYSI